MCIRDSVNEVPELYETGKELGVRQIAFGRFEPNRNVQNYLIPSQNDIMISLAELIRKNNRSPAFLLDLSLLKTFSFLDYNEGRKLLDELIANNVGLPPVKLKCHRDDRITITANGDVYLCLNTITEDKKFCLGNLREKSFYEIWENRFNNIFFQEKCYDKSICGKCKYLNLCNSGCPANAYFKNNCISAPDSYCNYAQELQNNIETIEVNK